MQPIVMGALLIFLHCIMLHTRIDIQEAVGLTVPEGERDIIGNPPTRADPTVASAPSDTTTAVSPALPPSHATTSSAFVDKMTGTPADSIDHEQVNDLMYFEYLDCLEFHEKDIENFKTISIKDDMAPTVIPACLSFWAVGRRVDSAVWLF